MLGRTLRALDHPGRARTILWGRLRNLRKLQGKREGGGGGVSRAAALHTPVGRSPITVPPTPSLPGRTASPARAASATHAAAIAAALRALSVGVARGAPCEGYLGS
jgi:hypothetical protein